MGRAVSTAAGELGLRIGAAVDVGDNPASGIGASDVIIDFSTPAATPALLRLAVKHRKPIVIGTTGHTAAEKGACSRSPPGFRASGRAIFQSASTCCFI